MNLLRQSIKEGCIIDLMWIRDVAATLDVYDGILLEISSGLKGFAGIIAVSLANGSQSLTLIDSQNDGVGTMPVFTWFSLKNRADALECIRFISYFTGLPVKEVRVI